MGFSFLEWMDSQADTGRCEDKGKLRLFAQEVRLKKGAPLTYDPAVSFDEVDISKRDSLISSIARHFGRKMNIFVRKSSYC